MIVRKTFVAGFRMDRLLFVLLGLLCASYAPAQEWRDTEEQIKRLVVMVRSRIGVGEPQAQGAGIISGADNDDIYLITANHLVRSHQQEAEQVEVRFYDAPSKVFIAELLEHYSPRHDLDLAVLRVPGAAQMLDLEALPFDRVVFPDVMQRGDPVFMLGYPLGKQWRININPERLAVVTKDLLEFESNLIRNGHSGGALLNSRRSLIGMLRSDEPPYGEAVTIIRIIAQLEEWGYPTLLRTPAPRVSAGHERSCHVNSYGEATCWGTQQRLFEAAMKPVGTARFDSISVGYSHACGLTFDGTAFCWGKNSSGQLGNGEVDSDKRFPHRVPLQVIGDLTFKLVSAGGHHTCALTPEGQAYCWGAGTGGRLGNDSGEQSPRPVPVAGGLTFQTISSGIRHTCGLTTDGEAYCWGGVLGTGKSRTGIDPPNAFIPFQLTPDKRFRSISAGAGLSCAITTAGEGYCWGSSENANIKAFSRQKTVTLVPVAGRLKFREISAGLGSHACGITEGGKAYCWGWNEHGQLGNQTTKDSYMPVPVSGGQLYQSISAGHFQTCAVTHDGSTYCWGSNYGGAVAPEQNPLSKYSQPQIMDLPARQNAHVGGRPPRTGLENLDRYSPNNDLTVKQVFENYTRALGGKKRIENFTQRVALGTAESPLFGNRVPVVIQQQAPNKWRVVFEAKGRKGVETFEVGFDGERAWKREVKKGESSTSHAVPEEVYPYFPFPRMLVGGRTDQRFELKGRTTLSEREVLVVEAVSNNNTRKLLYFDTQSDLLMYSFTDSALPAGLGRAEIYFKDFREVDGIKVPFNVFTTYADDQYILRVREFCNIAQASIDKLHSPLNCLEYEAAAEGSGWLGLTGQDVDKDMASDFGLQQGRGVLVDSVIEDGPARKAGLQKADIILLFDGKELENVNHLVGLATEAGVGRLVRVEIWRDRKRVSQWVSLGRAPSKEKRTTFSKGVKTENYVSKDSLSSTHSLLGLFLEIETRQLQKQFKLPAYDGIEGLVVTKVIRNSTADKKGFRPGDVILKVQHEDVKTPSEFETKIEELRQSNQRLAIVLIQRYYNLEFEILPIDTDAD